MAAIQKRLFLERCFNIDKEISFVIGVCPASFKPIAIIFNNNHFTEFTVSFTLEELNTFFDDLKIFLDHDDDTPDIVHVIKGKVVTFTSMEGEKWHVDKSGQSTVLNLDACDEIFRLRILLLEELKLRDGEEVVTHFDTITEQVGCTKKNILQYFVLVRNEIRDTLKTAEYPAQYYQHVSDMSTILFELINNREYFSTVPFLKEFVYKEKSD